jgi:hypothetical protein
VVTQDDVDQVRATDKRTDAELGDLATQSNVNLDNLPELFRRFALEQRISEALDQKFPGEEQAQLDAEYEKFLSATARKMHIRINPRYGTFDPDHGQITALAPDYLTPPAPSQQGTDAQ